MNILAIIPARKNSKGIKNKNIVKVNGKYLINYTINSAKKSKYITDIVGSTDSKKIAQIFKKNNIQFPFFRPKNLSNDKSNIIDTLIFTLKKIEKMKKNKYDYICLLQPTSPLRKKNEIDNAIKKIIKTNSDSLISLCKLDEPHPYKLVEIKNKKIIFNKNKRNKINNRQQMPDFYMPSGNIYITKRNILLKNKSFFGKKNIYTLIDPKNYININNSVDLKIAKSKLR
tara:strand:- start:489 stop:1172 length:684 start_codon:yes stop_codon:yes gene_type:complete